ncbi:hypothetical protein R3P38DRAFT_3216124 [Favolaschia claudopus]|uniref:Uncharacterized protein n=1 Tax=Favolaschia claudopus TaxID=2862362 RepID=A0AAW0A832_9AGAR
MAAFVLHAMCIKLVFWLCIIRLFTLGRSSPTGSLRSDDHIAYTVTSYATVPSPTHHLDATHTRPSFVTPFASSAVVTSVPLPSPLSHHNSCISVAQQLSPPTSVATSTMGGPEFAGADATTLLRRATSKVWARELETDTLPNGTSSTLYDDSDGMLSQRVTIGIVVCLMIFIAIVLSFYYFGRIWTWCQGSSPRPPPSLPRRSRSLRVTASILMSIVSVPAAARFPPASGEGATAGTQAVARPARGRTTEAAEDDEPDESRLSSNTVSTFVTDKDLEQGDLNLDDLTRKPVDRRSTFSSSGRSASCRTITRRASTWSALAPTLASQRTAHGGSLTPKMIIDISPLHLYWIPGRPFRSWGQHGVRYDATKLLMPNYALSIHVRQDLHIPSHLVLLSCPLWSLALSLRRRVLTLLVAPALLCHLSLRRSRLLVFMSSIPRTSIPLTIFRKPKLYYLSIPRPSPCS